MLRGSFIFGVLVSLSQISLAVKSVSEICRDAGLSEFQLNSIGLMANVHAFIRGYHALDRECFCSYEEFCKKRGRKFSVFFAGKPCDEGLYKEWQALCSRHCNYWGSNYQAFLSKLRSDYHARVAKKQQQEEEKRSQQLATEVKQLAQIQATLADVQRLQKEQSEKMDKLVAGNAQFIRFLVLMDSAITSERDIRARVEAAKQLLESDLVDEQQKVLLLNNKIKELKEKAETVAVENAELRAQMQAELEAIQVQLKERMLSMM